MTPNSRRLGGIAAVVAATLFVGVAVLIVRAHVGLLLGGAPLARLPVWTAAVCVAVAAALVAAAHRFHPPEHR